MPCQTERSVAWLSRLLWEQDIACSNQAAPTIFKRRKQQLEATGLENLYRKGVSAPTCSSALSFHCGIE